MTTWKKIGKIGPPQGLNGSFFLIGGEVFESTCTSAVIGKDPSCGIPVSLAVRRFSQDQWVLKIQGVEERKALDELRGQELWVESGEEPAHELIGTQVLDDTGKLLGQITAVTNYGASDIAVVQSPDQKCVDLPLVADFFSLPGVGKKLELKIPLSALAGLWYS